MTAEDFLESNQKLRVQQQVEQEDEEDRADELEAEELNNLRQVSCKTYEFCFSLFSSVRTILIDCQIPVSLLW